MIQSIIRQLRSSEARRSIPNSNSEARPNEKPKRQKEEWMMKRADEEGANAEVGWTETRLIASISFLSRLDGAS